MEQEDHDKERTKYLETQGYKVLRFWNQDVTNNITGVTLTIMNILEEQN